MSAARGVSCIGLGSMLGSNALAIPLMVATAYLARPKSGVEASKDHEQHQRQKFCRDRPQGRHGPRAPLSRHPCGLRSLRTASREDRAEPEQPGKPSRRARHGGHALRVPISGSPGSQFERVPEASSRGWARIASHRPRAISPTPAIRVRAGRSAKGCISARQLAGPDSQRRTCRLGRRAPITPSPTSRIPASSRERRAVRCMRISRLALVAFSSAARLMLHERRSDDVVPEMTRGSSERAIRPSRSLDTKRRSDVSCS